VKIAVPENKFVPTSVSKAYPQMAGLCLWDPLGLPHQQSNPASVRASVLSHFAQAMHGTNWILNGAMGLSFKSMGDFPASHGG
jgi:hypothetical protein